MKYIIYNAVLISDVQQNYSIIYVIYFIYIYIFFFKFPSIIGIYKILNIVPCAVQ